MKRIFFLFFFTMVLRLKINEAVAGIFLQSASYVDAKFWLELFCVFVPESLGSSLSPNTSFYFISTVITQDFKN